MAIAALGCIIGSFLPWLDTAVGSPSGLNLGGLITFSAATLALPGVLWRRPSVIAIHAGLLAVAALAVPLWRLGWALRTLPGLGTAWLPGTGMLLVLISGVTATVALVQLRSAARPA